MCMSVDDYTGFSDPWYFYLHFLSIDTMWCFNFALSLGINRIISGLNKVVKKRPLP